MPEKSDKIRENASSAAPAPVPEVSTPRYRKPQLVPQGQLKPAGQLLGSPPDPP